ncbi:uncharacterized protein DUF4167 [Rhodovulum imhoffii]|uniref:Uncharacterized protein DUF4167 n=1 Tax=Rhodovulum imhoffii TaxID=365340 RepID=A0A2T5BVM1_9RHOB|nr:DUF4167 domain-containing protein [Rhodovulum imhoffii]MBK5932813.1 nucleoside triphosphate hydrolase [Rhodovulum imhoffii]PTN03618.1 uncharacterized protein DUF4167 [Rhodovulum imhoffii]
MRSSKSRSRSKSNRSRSVGNIVNRVFDSSGPEGKVRGTPQQIIDKYNQLARDAQLANDRIAAENFQQHAEHYTRLLGEAQREMDARREQQEQQQRERQPRQEQPDSDVIDASRPDGGAGELGDTVNVGGCDPESGLVETPEGKSSKRRSPRSTRGPRKLRDAAAPEDVSSEAVDPAAPQHPSAAE